MTLRTSPALTVAGRCSWVSSVLTIPVADQLVHIEEGDADEVHDLDMAKAIGVALEKNFPNHFWVISFTGHNLIIRHLLIANAVTFASGKEGFGSLLPRSKLGTTHEAVETAVKFAASLLEAFKMKRGAWDGEEMPQIPPDLLSEITKGKQLRGWGKGH
jgi:hypothetical protein